MKPSEAPTRITYTSLKSKCEAYNRLSSSIIPPKLRVSDTLRYSTIPDSLAQGKKGKLNGNGKPSLSKEDLVHLMHWKLSHGTYRPNLAKLVASNNAKDVQEITQRAFEIYDDDDDDDDKFGEDNNKDSHAGSMKALSTLTELKGVGPATASLLLACYDPIEMPFFSDELFRYLHLGQEEKDREKLKKGWNRQIKYTVKEYGSLLEKLKILRKRVRGGEDGESGEETIKAVEVEKAAYVICREESEPKKRKMPVDVAAPAAAAAEEEEENENENDDGSSMQPVSKSKRRKTGKGKKGGVT